MHGSLTIWSIYLTSKQRGKGTLLSVTYNQVWISIRTQMLNLTAIDRFPYSTFRDTYSNYQPTYSSEPLKALKNLWSALISSETIASKSHTTAQARQKRLLNEGMYAYSI